MELQIYQIDAFAKKVFEGNPAAVVPLDTWLDDQILQNIAKENNLSETAFFVKRDESYELRWFTPLAEVDMCGHATLASAYVLFEELGYSKKTIHFETKSGLLQVKKEQGLYAMDFPILPLRECDIKNAIKEAFGKEPLATYTSMDYIVIFENEEDILYTKPNMELLKKLDLRGVSISAQSSKYDFVTRFFAPKIGVEEDPVTGSAFTQLVSYWGTKLNKNRLFAKQFSHRGGEVICNIKESRVSILGGAVKYMQGEISI